MSGGRAIDTLVRESTVSVNEILEANVRRSESQRRAVIIRRLQIPQAQIAQHAKEWVDSNQVESPDRRHIERGSQRLPGRHQAVETVIIVPRPINPPEDGDFERAVVEKRRRRQYLRSNASA